MQSLTQVTHVGAHIRALAETRIPGLTVKSLISKSLQVYRRPKVAVLSTGDEVVDPSTQNLGPGQIRDANRSMLLAAASSAGADVIDLGIARDTEGEVEACFENAVSQGADVLITSGKRAIP